HPGRGRGGVAAHRTAGQSGRTAAARRRRLGWLSGWVAGREGHATLPPEEVTGWFDSHCHIQDDPGGIDRARAAGVDRMVVVGTDRPESLAAVALAAQHDGVWATVGLHPHDATEGVQTVADLVGQAKVVAVGECGLDYHYDHSPRPVQREAFAAQIRLAH